MEQLSGKHGLSLAEARLAALLGDLAEPRLTKRADPARAVATDGQRSLWFLHRLRPESLAYTVPLVVDIEGELSPAWLERALTELVRRHEVLRTTFREEHGELLQIIQPPTPFKLDTRAIALRQFVAEPWDLVSGPLFRAQFARLSPGKERLVLLAHHAVIDAWSGNLLFHELCEIYRELSDTGNVTMRFPELQYADFAEWDAARVFDADIAYWTAKLADVPPLRLPTDRPRRPGRASRGEKVTLALDALLIARLDAYARGRHATLYMALLTLFKSLVGRLSGQNDLLVASGIARRGLPELETMSGLFLNNLMLRTTVDPKSSFDEALAAVRATTLEAYEHHEVPFEKISLPFDVVFTLSESSHASGNVPGGQLSLADPNLVDVGAAKHDLSVHLWTENGHVRGVFEADAELFDRATVERWTRYYTRLIAAAIEDPAAPLASHDLLDDRERHLVLHAWNHTESSTEAPLFLERLATQDPAALAVAPDVTHARLDEVSGRLAAHLVTRGLPIDTPVAVMTSRTANLPIAFVGVLKAGGAYLPLDPQQPDERLRKMLDEARPPFLVTDRAMADRAAAFGIPSLVVEDLGPAPRVTLPLVGPHHLAYVLFTSGSTGTPKGVAVEHKALAHLVAWCHERYLFGPGDHGAFLTGVGFDPTIEELGGYLACGVTLHMAPDDLRLSAPETKRWLAREAITICQLPTPVLERLLEDPFPMPSALRLLLTGGDKLRRRPGRELRPRLFNRYGPTEYTVYATDAHVVADEEAEPSIGKPIRNTRVWLLDEWRRPVPIGAPGEIYLGGDGLACGYYNKPALTAERFVEIAGRRFYRTGDLARYRADGSLQFLGRVDGQVKIRGMRIETGEIEAALRRHPGVREALACVREEMLVAYVVGHVDTERLRASLRDALPEAMVPTAIAEIERFPLTPNGKVDVKALPVPLASVRTVAPPRGETQTKIAECWREILGREVGADDNFFDVGGHSLLIAKLHARLVAVLGRDFPLLHLFKFPTVASLAEAVGIELGRTPEGDCPSLDEARLRAATRRMRARNGGR